MSRSCFKGDVDFCPDCGSILPLPGSANVVTCYQCKFQIDIKDFDGLKFKSHIVFNKREVKTAGFTSEDMAGPVVDHRCVKCGNEQMTYSTRQTRSADEGQTVFYKCPKCGHQEQEYS